MSGLDVVYARSDRMVGRRIAGEYVLVPLGGKGVDLDAILNLNSVGAFIWEQVGGAASRSWRRCWTDSRWNASRPSGTTSVSWTLFERPAPWLRFGLRIRPGGLS